MTDQTREAVERLQTVIARTLAGKVTGTIADVDDLTVVLAALSDAEERIAEPDAIESAEANADAWFEISQEAQARAIKAEAERDTALARIAGMEAGEPAAWTGSGSLAAVTAGLRGYLWGKKGAAHPIALYTHQIHEPQNEEGPAEREVGRYIYKRISALMNAEPDTAAARELAYLAEVVGDVEEYGADKMDAGDVSDSEHFATPALARAEVPEGWKLVPETPTPEMCWAWANGLNPLETWSKMLAATPAPTVKGEGK